MCGFVGYFGKDKKDLRESAELISHRGPDQTSFEINENYRLARLTNLNTSVGFNLNDKSFLKKNNVKWQHFDIAIGNQDSVEDFCVLKHFPASGSSINNILVNSLP